MKKQFIVPHGIHVVPTYSHAVRAGQTVYLAGQVGRNEDGKLAANDLAGQTRQIFENMQLTLEAAGASLRDLVKLTIYLTDIDGMKDVAQIRSGFLRAPMPASTALQVAKLAPGVLIEIDGIAVIDDE